MEVKKQTKKDEAANQTKEKVEAAKSYIERKYSKLKEEEKEKKENWEQLQAKMHNMNLSLEEQELIKKEILHKEAEQMRMKRKKLTAKDFEPITIIGKGAFGEVRLCRWVETGEIVAIKKMKKSEMIYKNQVVHIRTERDIMAMADNPWIVELKCSFQDEKFLYLVMEFLPGGDLMTLLMKRDILTEEEAKFYMAECIIAVDGVHKLNYIHRDLKPDNILIDIDGHVKLSDFGLCKHIGLRMNKNDQQEIPQNEGGFQLPNKKSSFKRNRQLAFSTVGTPDYIAPEVFGQSGYTQTVDWWSLGVILFEMLVGYPPFFSDDPASTCQKIMHWRKTLVIPDDANLSNAAIDLIKKMVNDSRSFLLIPDTRLGVNGVEEIKAHPFFFGIDWRNIRNKKSVWIPEIKGSTDTAFFDKFDEDEPWITSDLNDSMRNKKKGRKDVNFIGYTFNRHVENQRSSLVSALLDLEHNRGSGLRPQFRANELKTEGPETNVRDSIGSRGEKGRLTNSINFKNFLNSKTDVSGEGRQTEPISKSSNFSKFLQGTTFGNYISGEKSKLSMKFQRKPSKGESNSNDVHPVKPSTSKKREELSEKFAQINERYSTSSNNKTPLKIVNAKLGTNLRDFMFNFK